MPKLAILSVSAGAGHIRAAEAIKAAVGRSRPDVACDHIDVMELVPKLFRRLYSESYIKVERLKKLAKRHPGRLFPQGFTTTIERLMACSDLAISKPGGLTTSECLAMGLPMLVISPIPGQEERNADYLLENGAGLKAHDAAGLEFRTREILANPQRLEQLRAGAKKLGRPEAAQRIVKLALQ